MKTEERMNCFAMFYDKDNYYYNYLSCLNNATIPYSNIKSYLDSDFMIVTFISGNEIRFKDLARISQNSKGVLFGDIHHFIYDKPVNGHKPFKKIDFWKEWINCFDIIQGTTFEWEFLLKNSPFNKYTENLPQYPTEEMKKRFFPVAEYILNKTRPNILLLTDGKFGAYAFYKKDSKITVLFEPALSFDKIKDTTGCGDTFSGGFLYKYIATGNVKTALKFAVYLSGWKTQIFGLWNQKKYNTIKN